MDKWQTILERFLRNECTERENKIVFYALRDGLIDEEFRCAIDKIIEDEETFAYIDQMKPVSDDVLKSIRLRLNKQINKPAGHRSFIPEWLKIAAAVIITLSVSWMAFLLKPSEKPLPYTSMNTIHVSAGQSVNLTLSDGTDIWLNSRSTLKYPNIFSGNKRELILDGEGFFDVAHDQKKPFVVHAGGYDIRALGTQFNVSAYSDRGDFSASLFDGAIKVTSDTDTLQAIVLHPNTRVRLQEGRLITENITDFSHYRWREGLICFNNMPFPELMIEFEKCYGVKISVENNRVKTYAPTGKFRKSEGIDYALRVLQRNFRFRIERDDKNHIIYIK